jgi:hypothetical protein
MPIVIRPSAHRILETVTRNSVRSDEAAADLVARRFPSAFLQRELHYAAAHRSEFIWPWEEEPRSITHGILDDETYDWFASVQGMLASGGDPVVVDERRLVEAYNLARETTGINVDHTGAAGLAGLMQLSRDGAMAPRENVAVIFSGVQRGARCDAAEAVRDGSMRATERAPLRRFLEHVAKLAACGWRRTGPPRPPRRPASRGRRFSGRGRVGLSGDRTRRKLILQRTIRRGEKCSRRDGSPRRSQNRFWSESFASASFRPSASGRL